MTAVKSLLEQRSIADVQNRTETSVFGANVADIRVDGHQPPRFTAVQASQVKRIVFCLAGTRVEKKMPAVRQKDGITVRVLFAAYIELSQWFDLAGRPAETNQPGAAAVGENDVAGIVPCGADVGVAKCSDGLRTAPVGADFFQVALGYETNPAAIK